MTPVSDAQIEQALQVCRQLAYRYRHLIPDQAIDTDDLAQAAAIGVLKASTCWRPELTRADSFTAWARYKAEAEIRHLLRDCLPGRRHGRQLRTVSLDEPAWGVDDGDALTVGEQVAAPIVDLTERIALRDALIAMPARQRAAVLGVALGLTQQEAADQFGVSQMTVSRWARGQQAEPRAATVCECDDCTNEVAQPRTGRSRRFCSNGCRRRHHARVQGGYYERRAAA